MREEPGDIWDHRCIAITTNGDTNRLGQAVMGRGVALQAKTPDTPGSLTIWAITYAVNKETTSRTWEGTRRLDAHSTSSTLSR